MSTKGCCWDNAVVESLFSTLTHELRLDDDADVLLTPQQLLRDLAFWIESDYNRERRHSTLGYLSRLLTSSSSSLPVLSLLRIPDRCPSNRGKPRKQRRPSRHLREPRARAGKTLSQGPSKGREGARPWPHWHWHCRHRASLDALAELDDVRSVTSNQEAEEDAMRSLLG